MRQQGQVLVWFLAFAATLAVVFAGVYSVGQATSEKQKIVSAADAAAYSGGLVQARSLNLVAYSNRAVIANEVLIAQMVSMQSWTHYFESATNNYENILQGLAAVTTVLPPLSAVIRVLAQGMRAVNKIADMAATGFDKGVPLLINSWEAAFTAWYSGMIKAAFIPPVMANSALEASSAVLRNSVATQNGRKDTAAHLVSSEVISAMNEMEWQRISHRYIKGAGGQQDGRKTAAELILISRDEFSIERPGSDIPFIKTFFGSDKICIPFAFVIGSEKQGTTKLVNYDRWEAQDTVEFKQKISPNGCSWGKGTNAVPVGWGRSVADQNGSTNGNYLETDGGAGRMAYKDTQRNRGWTGIKELYDVPRGRDARPSKDEIFYLVAAAKDKSQVPVNENLNIAARPMSSPLGSPDLKVGFAQDQVSSISQARIFFERPQRDNRDVTGVSLFRADGHKEYASFYNPYWQVRLSSVSEPKKSIIYGTLGLPSGTSVFAQ